MTKCNEDELMTLLRIVNQQYVINIEYFLYLHFCILYFRLRIFLLVAFEELKFFDSFKIPVGRESMTDLILLEEQSKNHSMLLVPSIYALIELF